MKKSRKNLTNIIRIFTLVLVVGMFIILILCWTNLEGILSGLRELGETDPINKNDYAEMLLNFEAGLGWFIFFMLYTLITVGFTLKVVFDMYYANKQGSFINAVNQIVSQIDQQTDLAQIKLDADKLSLEIANYANNGASKKVFDTIYQIYAIKSMRVEADFEKLRSYTSIIMKACAESLNLGNAYNDKKISKIADAAVMYDVGKLCVPGYILYKDGNLSQKEFEIAKYHAYAGYQLINGIKQSQKQGTYESYVKEIVAYHHEKFDGSGYPFKKAGEEIPFIARIIAIVSTYDTVTRDRPYSRAMTHEEAVLLINNEKGRTFDPNIVKLFNAVESQFKRIKDTQALS